MLLTSWGPHGRFTLDGFTRKFWARTTERDGCLLWMGARVSNRYGNVSCQGRPWLAHRLAWVLTHGDIPEGLHVCHTCDNGLCVNPEHLFLGTQQENVWDMERKGRSRHPKGEHHGRAKLTSEQVAEAKALRAEGWSTYRLGRHFGVSRTTIGSLLRGKTWATN